MKLEDLDLIVEYVHTKNEEIAKQRKSFKRLYLLNCWLTDILDENEELLKKAIRHVFNKDESKEKLVFKRYATYVHDTTLDLSELDECREFCEPWSE